MLTSCILLGLGVVTMTAKGLSGTAFTKRRKPSLMDFSSDKEAAYEPDGIGYTCVTQCTGKRPGMGRQIYFAGSIRGGRQDVDLYYKIIEELKNYGKVLTEFVGDKNVMEKDGTLAERKTDSAVHDEDVRMLGECDCLIAEVTQPSLGVGYEIGRAVAMKKKVLCLYRPQEGKMLSCMIRGAENGDTFIVKDYKEFPEAVDILKDYFQ